VLVDIPGINEAGSSQKYKNYVNEKWDTFDAAIVVMDAKQGVNTEDQVELLKFVKTNNATRKDIPFIILCNKVDDPEEPEQAILVAETKREVERIFGVKCRTHALKKILSDPPVHPPRPFPIFIPTSAIHAFIYQTVSMMDFEKFKSFDAVLVNRMGRELVGAVKWKRMSSDARHKALYEVIADPTMLKELVAETNFDKFHKALAYCVGGKSKQAGLIRKQVQVDLEKISTATSIGEQIETMNAKLIAVGQATDHLKTCFWKTYRKCRKEALLAFEKSPACVSDLGNPMGQLVSYMSSSKRLGWADELPKILEAGKQLVQAELGVIFEKEAEAEIEDGRIGWQSATPNLISTWKDLQPSDWLCIIDSVLLTASDSRIISKFGQEKLYLDRLRLEIAPAFAKGAHLSDCPTCSKTMTSNFSGIKNLSYCNACSQRYVKCEASNINGMECPACRNPSYRLDINGYCRSYCGNTFIAMTNNEKFRRISRCKYVEGKFQPADKADFEKYQKLNAPGSLTDPSHFGYVAHLYCGIVSQLSPS